MNTNKFCAVMRWLFRAGDTDFDGKKCHRKTFCAQWEPPTSQKTLTSGQIVWRFKSIIQLHKLLLLSAATAANTTKITMPTSRLRSRLQRSHWNDKYTVWLDGPDENYSSGVSRACQWKRLQVAISVQKCIRIVEISLSFDIKTVKETQLCWETGVGQWRPAASSIWQEVTSIV